MYVADCDVHQINPMLSHDPPQPEDGKDCFVQEIFRSYTAPAVNHRDVALAIHLVVVGGHVVTSAYDMTLRLLEKMLCARDGDLEILLSSQLQNPD